MQTNSLESEKLNCARAIVAKMRTLISDERESLVVFLRLLSDIDEQQLYRELGYASTWDFLRRAFHFSEKMAYYRLASSRALRKFPSVGDRLRDGRLCITTLATFSKLLTDDNYDLVLDETIGRSKLDILRIQARLQQSGRVQMLEQSSVAQVHETPIPSREVTCGQLFQTGGLESALQCADVASQGIEAEAESLVGVARSVVFAPPLAAVQPPPLGAVQRLPRNTIKVLSENDTRRGLNTDREFEDLLVAAKAALSHKMPFASELDILKEALRTVVKQHEKRKGIVDKPRAAKDHIASGDEGIPACVKRTVWKRDGGKCQFRGEHGICGSSTRVQFHHIHDRALGGPHTVENLQLLCAGHNLLEAERVWGASALAIARGYRGGRRRSF